MISLTTCTGKRIVRDPGGYYAALAKPHVDVESAPARVTRKGIVTQDGREIELDAIIYATGYHLDFLSNIGCDLISVTC